MVLLFLTPELLQNLSSHARARLVPLAASTPVGTIQASANNANVGEFAHPLHWKIPSLQRPFSSRENVADLLNMVGSEPTSATLTHNKLVSTASTLNGGLMRGDLRLFLFDIAKKELISAVDPSFAPHELGLSNFDVTAQQTATASSSAEGAPKRSDTLSAKTNIAPSKGAATTSPAAATIRHSVGLLLTSTPFGLHSLTSHYALVLHKLDALTVMLAQSVPLYCQTACWVATSALGKVCGTGNRRLVIAGTGTLVPPATQQQATALGWGTLPTTSEAESDRSARGSNTAWHSFHFRVRWASTTNVTLGGGVTTPSVYCGVVDEGSAVALVGGGRAAVAANLATADPNATSTTRGQMQLPVLHLPSGEHAVLPNALAADGPPDSVFAVFDVASGVAFQRTRTSANTLGASAPLLVRTIGDYLEGDDSRQALFGMPATIASPSASASPARIDAALASHVPSYVPGTQTSATSSNPPATTWEEVITFLVSANNIASRTVLPTVCRVVCQGELLHEIYLVSGASASWAPIVQIIKAPDDDLSEVSVELC